ncbi:MAG: cation:dicarboxylase symporter family transporter [Gemmatimonadales bacterium]|nr:cation:dicarboxylase symporter family transporter [Gemmatimonadales bacterium]NIN12887.1 cation:dicarboxylase symporter family transporter [Gemmatimonadales bacterium]NIR00174.1 cation:dicarboxylase symporter family transporter [Gemmatimonadales bacterium]NIS65967.1 cation:dicarboxylase symporter family transporter [Gemmatimonadales bacterium]
MRGIKLHTKILLGLILGAVFGPLLGNIAVQIKPVGDAFINLLIMIVVPLVMASLIVGTASLGDLRKLGRIGIKTVGYYLVATALAVAMGLAAGKAFKPGAGMDEETKASMLADYAGVTEEQLQRVTEKPSLGDFLVRIIPRNPFRAMAETNFLQIIFFAILFGIALTILGEQHRKPVLDILNTVNDAMIVLVKMVMRVAPYGVFALIAAVSAQFGYGVLLTLLKYVVVAVGTMAVFTVTFYPISLRLSGMSPVFFFKKYYEVMLFAFSTSSSNATLPVNLEVSENELGVSNQVAAFVLPLGATVNMNGTAIYQGVSTIFIAQVFGISLGLMDLLTVVLTATLASIGAAGVPGIGMVTLTIVLTQLGIPLEGIALVVGVERILDMTRTTVNVTGDTACAIWVAKTEKELNVPVSEEVSAYA